MSAFFDPLMVAGLILILLLICAFCYQIGYLIGKDHGYREGYRRGTSWHRWKEVERKSNGFFK